MAADSQQAGIPNQNSSTNVTTALKNVGIDFSNVSLSKILEESTFRAYERYGRDQENLRKKGENERRKIIEDETTRFRSNFSFILGPLEAIKRLPETLKYHAMRITSGTVERATGRFDAPLEKARSQAMHDASALSRQFYRDWDATKTFLKEAYDQQQTVLSTSHHHISDFIRGSDNVLKTLGVNVEHFSEMAGKFIQQTMGKEINPEVLQIATYLGKQTLDKVSVMKDTEIEAIRKNPKLLTEHLADLTSDAITDLKGGLNQKEARKFTYLSHKAETPGLDLKGAELVEFKQLQKKSETQTERIKKDISKLEKDLIKSTLDNDRKIIRENISSKQQLLKMREELGYINPHALYQAVEYGEKLLKDILTADSDKLKTTIGDKKQLSIWKNEYVESLQNLKTSDDSDVIQISDTDIEDLGIIESEDVVIPASTSPSSARSNISRVQLTSNATIKSGMAGLDEPKDNLEQSRIRQAFLAKEDEKIELLKQILNCVCKRETEASGKPNISGGIGGLSSWASSALSKLGIPGLAGMFGGLLGKLGALGGLFGIIGTGLLVGVVAVAGYQLGKLIGNMMGIEDKILDFLSPDWKKKLEDAAKPLDTSSPDSPYSKEWQEGEAEKHGITTKSAQNKLMTRSHILHQYGIIPSSEEHIKAMKMSDIEFEGYKNNLEEVESNRNVEYLGKPLGTLVNLIPGYGNDAKHERRATISMLELNRDTVAREEFEKHHIQNPDRDWAAYYDNLYRDDVPSDISTDSSDTSETIQTHILEESKHEVKLQEQTVNAIRDVNKTLAQVAANTNPENQKRSESSGESRIFNLSAAQGGGRIRTKSDIWSTTIDG